MSKHTPGPWSRDKYGYMIDANGESIVLRGTTTLCSGSSDRLEMAEANTDLACAAPELLAALERLVRNGQKQSWGDHYPADMENAYAAIEKARGEK